MRLHLSIGLLALATMLAAPASAQLDLPDKLSESQGSRPRRGRSVPGLDLPDTAGRGRAERLGLEAGSAPDPAAPEIKSFEPSELTAAEALLLELRNRKSSDRAYEAEFAQRLLALGEPGLVAARGALGSTSALVRVTVQRVLLQSGFDADRALVLRSLHEHVPGRSAHLLLNGLVELDPVAASPELFLELLGHSQASMRTAAADHLSGKLDETHLDDLRELLDSSRADTRLYAVRLASRISALASVELMFAALADADARVASEAARSLARSPNETVVPRLKGIVDASPRFDRFQAYALVAILEREDLSGQPILASDSVDVLLRNLAEGIDLAVGASACALAGIGFRSDGSTPSQWLELLVPHHLVRIVAGTEFQPDLASLEEVARRRLALISGRDFGGDGRAWLEWWANSAKEFRAHRAFIPVTSADADKLRMTYRDKADGLELGFYGDAAKELVQIPASSYWLSKKQCIDLYRVLDKEGLFTAERLPSVRTSGAVPERELIMTAGAYEKSFFVVASGAEPWFERVVEVLFSLRDQNRWQRYFSVVKRTEDPVGWLAEKQFWSEPHTAAERARRTKGLVLDSLPVLGESALDAGLDDLEQLFAQPGVADAADFGPLRERLRLESFYSPTVSRLVGLALTAARMESPLADAPARVALDGSPAMDDELARGMTTLVGEQFGIAAVDDLARILRASTKEYARLNASLPRIYLRAAAIRALALDLSPEVDELLDRALVDPEFEVRAAAVQSLGERCAALIDRPETAERRLEWADEIEARLDSEVGSIQLAAVRAMARSGDERAVGAMLAAINSPLPTVRQAAAEGMASLHDPSLAPVLVSLLARGPRAVVFQPARRGLRELGSGAHEELLRIVNRREPGLSREAALILAEAEVPEVASSLLTILTERPTDERVALELAILTCVDFRGEPDPSGAWWSWWDTVRKDSAEAWLFAAAERLGLRAPAEGALKASGTREGAELLLALLRAEQDYLVTRAERELTRMLGHEFELPGGAAEREAFLTRNWPQ